MAADDGGAPEEDGGAPAMSLPFGSRTAAFGHARAMISSEVGGGVAPFTRPSASLVGVATMFFGQVYKNDHFSQWSGR